MRVVEKKPKDDGILTWMIKQIGTSGRRTTRSDLHKAPIDLLNTSCAYVTICPFKISRCAKIVPSTIKIVVVVKNRRALKCYLSVYK